MRRSAYGSMKKLKLEECKINRSKRENEEENKRNSLPKPSTVSQLPRQIIALLTQAFTT